MGTYTEWRNRRYAQGNVLIQKERTKAGGKLFAAIAGDGDPGSYENQLVFISYLEEARATIKQTLQEILLGDRVEAATKVTDILLAFDNGLKAEYISLHDYAEMENRKVHV